MAHEGAQPIKSGRVRQIQVPLELVGVEGPVPWHYDLPEDAPIELQHHPDLWEAIERGLAPCLGQFEGLVDEKRRQQKTVCVSLCFVAFMSAATEFLGITQYYIWVPVLSMLLLVGWRLWWVRTHLPGVLSHFESSLEEGFKSVLAETGVRIRLVRGDMIFEETFRGRLCDAQRAGQSEMFIELEVSADEIPMVSERLVDVEQPLDPQLDQPLISASAVRAKGKEHMVRMQSRESKASNAETDAGCSSIGNSSTGTDYFHSSTGTDYFRATGAVDANV
mmetsp:Transcript_44211/g.102111  ORF Transcript_44211/g.102111 Transcript_44211/m.102111 type:complete len:278 (-) Transcript_44211:337-1170(-)